MIVQNDNRYRQDLESSIYIEKVRKIEPFAVLEGDTLRLFQVTHDSFKEDKDIPSKKKNLKDYKIEFKQDEKYWYVYYGISNERLYALLDDLRESGRSHRGGSSETTKEVLYKVRKEDYKLVSRLFFK